PQVLISRSFQAFRSTGILWHLHTAPLFPLAARVPCPSGARQSPRLSAHPVLLFLLPAAALPHISLLLFCHRPWPCSTGNTPIQRRQSVRWVFPHRLLPQAF